MQLLELVGRRSGVARLMLTVFHANTAALALYKRLGWVLLCTCWGAWRTSAMPTLPPLPPPPQLLQLLRQGAYHPMLQSFHAVSSPAVLCARTAPAAWCIAGMPTCCSARAIPAHC